MMLLNDIGHAAGPLARIQFSIPFCFHGRLEYLLFINLFFVSSQCIKKLECNMWSLHVECHLLFINLLCQ